MILDGRTLAAEILARARARAELLPHPPRVVAYVPSEPSAVTRSYLNIKKKSAAVAGCVFIEADSALPLSDFDAAIVQFPTTRSQQEIDELLPIEKDADVLSTGAREKFERGVTGALLPPVAGAVKEILETNHTELKGRRAVVVGEGFLVGKPVATWLRQQGAEVTVMTIENSRGELAASLRFADIVVSGAGSAGLITPDMISEGVVLIDAGTTESAGVLKGDADPACAAKCSLFTPVPGGVGPVTVAYLFANAVELASRV